MTEYRRAHVPGATWFFTVNLAERKGNRLLVSHIDALGWALVRQGTTSIPVGGDGGLAGSSSLYLGVAFR